VLLFEFVSSSIFRFMLDKLEEKLLASNETMLLSLLRINL
jgi:hypothetical protein